MKLRKWSIKTNAREAELVLQVKAAIAGYLIPALASMDANSLHTMDPLFLILHCLLYGK